MISRNKIFIFGLIVLVILSISAVSANENQTIIKESSEDVQTNDNPDYNAYIIAEDVNVQYSPYNELNIQFIDGYGNDLYDVNPEIIWDDGVKERLYDWDEYEGYTTYIDRDVGDYKFDIILGNSYYNAPSQTINVHISKASAKLYAKEYYTTVGQYATLKVIVKDQNNDLVDEGVVKFTINGRSFDVNVKDGVAAKKIKFSKAKTYNYKASFSGKNYNSKTVYSKLHFYPISKKARTINIKGYKIIIPINKYKKLVNAKNTNKAVFFEINTNKYIKQTVGSYKPVYKWKYVGIVSPETAHERGWKVKNYVKHWISDGEYYYTCEAYKKVLSNKLVYNTVKAKVSFLISYGGKYGIQTAPANKYCAFLNTPYQNPGYERCMPWLSGTKKSSELINLNKAKVTSY